MSEDPARSGRAAAAGPADVDRSAWIDALTGADGTAEPRQPMIEAVFFADGTAEPRQASAVAGLLPEVPVPLVPVPVPLPGPGMAGAARSPALVPSVAQRRPTPATPRPRPSGQPVASKPAPGIPRGSRPAQYRAPVSVNMPGSVGPPVVWLPPGGAPAPNQSLPQFLSQFPNVSIPGMSAGPAQFVPTNQPFPGATNPPALPRSNRPPAAPVRPTARRPQRSSRGSAVWSVLVLLVIILFASGLGQQIIRAIEQALHR